ncbi:small ubiquitin-related modifier 2-like [Lontra canadensis]|uniref:small ubiquitin-related modifier 2-like n=1 Tax=Lontra canadensis TaxID=76717 RepID=UPI0013F3878E|nr:small ubiquitin-related modifier 2-like [Lontra canadensis]
MADSEAGAGKCKLISPDISLGPLKSPRNGVKTENNNPINFKVTRQDSSVAQFKRHTPPLSKLVKAHCQRQGLPMQIRFRSDRQPIYERDTPAQLEMEDEDTTDVFQQQTGVY